MEEKRKKGQSEAPLEDLKNQIRDIGKPWNIYAVNKSQPQFVGT